MFDIFDESPDFETPYDLIKDLEEKDTQALAGKGESAESRRHKERAEIIKKWQKHPTGFYCVC